MLSTLITELQVLERCGYGDRDVIDDKGNNVVQVTEPIARRPNDGLGDDADAIMLTCAGSSSGATT